VGIKLRGLNLRRASPLKNSAERNLEILLKNNFFSDGKSADIIFQVGTCFGGELARF